MRLWPRRNKSAEQSTNGVPPEVKEYYETGKRERKSIAWLLAAATLIATIVVVFGAFLGGRWVYRKIANSGKEVSTTQNEQSEEQDSDEITDLPSQPSPNPSPNPTPSPSQTNPSQTQTPAPSAGQSANLPQSGPAETMAVFAIATVAGTIFYQIKLRRQS